MTEASQLQLAGEASRLLKAQQDEKALAILDKLVEAFPDHEEILASRAFCLGKLGRFDEAYRIADRLSSVNHTQRVEQLREFLDARQASSKPTPAPAQESAGTKNLFSVLTVTTDESSRELAKKLEQLRSNLEQEFQKYQEQEQQSQQTIAELKLQLRERESLLAETKTKNDELETLLTDISDDVAQLHRESAAQALTIHEPDTASLESQQEIKRLQQNIQEKDETLAATFRKNAGLEKELSSLKEEVESFTSQEPDSQLDKDKLSAALDNEQILKDQIIDLEIENKTLRVEVNESESRLEQDRDILAVETETTQSDLAESRKQIELLAADKADLEQRIAQLRDQFEDDIDHSSKDRVTITALQNELDERNELLESTLETMASMTEQLDSLESEVNRLENNEKQAKSQLDEIVPIAEEQNSLHQALQDEHSTLSEEFLKARQDFDALNNQQSTDLEKLESDYKHAEERLQSLQEEHTNQQQVNEQSRLQLEDAVSKLENQLQEALAEKQSTIEESRIQLENTSKELDTQLQDTLAQKQSEINESRSEWEDVNRNLETQLQDALAQIDEVTGKLKELQSELSDTKTELSKIQNQLHESQSHLSEESSELELKTHTLNKQQSLLEEKQSTLGRD